MIATTPTRQASGAPLGLALLLERGGVTLVAPALALAPGVTLLEFAATLPGPRPGSAAECRARAYGLGSVRLRVEVEALLAWVRGRVAAGLPGWSVEQVEWNMAERTGDAGVWTLRGRDEAGARAWLRVEATVALRGGVVELGARRCWWMGPAGTTAARQWRALARRLCGRGVAVVGGRLVVDVLRAGIGVEFAAAGWAAAEGGGGGVSLAGRGWGAGVAGWCGGEVGAGRGWRLVVGTGRGWKLVVGTGRWVGGLRSAGAGARVVAGRPWRAGAGGAGAGGAGCGGAGARCGALAGAGRGAALCRPRGVRGGAWRVDRGGADGQRAAVVVGRAAGPARR